MVILPLIEEHVYKKRNYVKYFIFLNIAYVYSRGRRGNKGEYMQPMTSQELNRRIDTFLAKKHEEYPELRLRPQAIKKEKSVTASIVVSELLAGFKWEFGR